ncbi:MAG: (E)-4-hydroxy-3-methylbut-2-enyl-diphosphate synthase [Paludibacteraceae bacterium]|nr:(E)-4-hydroxy-3-methylbut-2-enyl-diphosphate synthase [Paludibacteraceae bacterium]
MNSIRRETKSITVGSIRIGSEYPIRVQTMANTDTNDIEASVSQAKRCIEAGAELLRYTTQGTKEAENLGIIHNKLQSEGYTTPLVADIHFNPHVAETAAKLVEKIRINPGNFVSSKEGEYSEKEWAEEINKIREKLFPLLDICKQHNTCVRIGVNHGSLSKRIVSKYGNTPLGLAKSCMEFIDLCEEAEFYNLILSIKASNTRVMVYAVRMLVEMMEKSGKNYPLHLGVTEAGSDTEGRIKSASGIGTLLSEGIGDTIRVSLSEAPEAEIPVAKNIVEYINTYNYSTTIQPKQLSRRTSYNKRKSNEIHNIGGENVPIVVTNKANNTEIHEDYTIDNIPNKVLLEVEKIDISTLELLKTHPEQIIFLTTKEHNFIGTIRLGIEILSKNNIYNPIIVTKRYNENNLSLLQIKSAIDFGGLLIDGLIDGIYINNENIAISEEEVCETSFQILQSTRARFSTTEYISCPSCGRTKFDLPERVKEVKKATKHLKGLKIAVMGCIVNGPGEMADADYGYIGAGFGKVSLYKGKECIVKNIPEGEAIKKLLEIINNNI